MKRQTNAPVTTGEIWNVWLDHPELVSAVDYIAAHILPAEPGLLAIDWRFATARLAIRANLTGEAKAWPDIPGQTIFAHSGGSRAGPSILVAIGPP